MLLDRSEIPAQYDVIDAIPLPTGVEKLQWSTNIFIAADLSEVRMALSASPAINITYKYTLNCSNRTLIEKVVNSKNEWLIPYLPHSTRGNIISSPYITTTSITATSINGNYYPYKDYFAVWNERAIVYRAITAPNNDGSSLLLNDRFANIPLYDTATESPFFIAPAVTAYIKPQIGYTDVGKYKDGSEISLEFRLTGESELALTYQQDKFAFIDTLQSPIQVSQRLNQARFAPMPARAHAHAPYARMYDEAPIINATYWLGYDDYNRDDYTFRGYFMKALGSLTAGHYVDENKLHRLADDTITINYDTGITKATCRMREVMT